MSAKSFDSQKVIEYLDCLDSQGNSFMIKADNLRNAYNTFIDNETFDGDAADAAKRLLNEVEIQLLDDVVESQKYLMQLYLHMLGTFQEKVDSSDYARISIPILEVIHDEYYEKYKQYKEHASNITEIARIAQLRYGDIYPITQPDSTVVENAFEDLIGVNYNKGHINKCIEKFEDFDDEEIIYAKNMDLDGYLDNVDLKISRLCELLDKYDVLINDYNLTTQYIDYIINGSIIDETLFGTVFNWLECSPNDRIRNLVNSPFYKILKSKFSVDVAIGMSFREGAKYIATLFDTFGKGIHKYANKLIDIEYNNSSDIVFDINALHFEPLFIAMYLPTKLCPNSEYAKVYDIATDCRKRFYKGCQKGIVDVGTGLLSIPKDILKARDSEENSLISVANYIKNNGLKNLHEDLRRDINEMTERLKTMKAVIVEDLSVKIDTNTIGDWYEDSGYITGTIMASAGIAKVGELLSGVEVVEADVEAENVVKSISKTDIYLDGIVDTAGNIDAEKMRTLRLAIQRGEFSKEEISELCVKVGELGITEEYESTMKNINFGKYLRNIVGEPPEGMYDPHAHHILFKTGLKGRQQELVKEGQRILREYGIDPIVGQENIVWAPRGVVGQHTTVSLEKVVDGLKCIDDMGGDYEQIVKALKKYGKNASLIK